MARIKIISGANSQPDGLQLGITGEKLGFMGATPVVQPASADQAALVDSTGGSVANSTLAAVGATNGGDVSAAINANFAKVAELVNAQRAALVSLGIIKGAA